MYNFTSYKDAYLYGFKYGFTEGLEKGIELSLNFDQDNTDCPNSSTSYVTTMESLPAPETDTKTSSE